MFFAHMLCESFSFSEALSTVFAAESFGAFVNGLVALQSGACNEAFAAARDLTGVFAFVCMCRFNVLLQVFILNVVLITVIIGALEWTGIGV